MIQQYGHPILLIKQNRTVKCHCYNELYRSSNTKCPDCFGLGYLYEINKQLCRSQTAAIPETLPRTLGKQEIGIVAIPTRVFYLTHTALPQTGDYVVECAWEGEKPVIDEYTSAYEINYPDPQRGDNGRIEFFRVACARDPINADLRPKYMCNRYYLGLSVGGVS